MSKKSYCNKCSKLTYNSRKFNAKRKVDGWLALLFDLPCKVCGKVTWQQLEVTRPLPSGRTILLMSITNRSNVDLMDIFVKTKNHLDDYYFNLE